MTDEDRQARALAIVPAAGRSRRMGRTKATLPYGESTMIDALLAALEGGGVRTAYVVLAQDSPLWEHLEGHPTARLVENPRPEGGMLSSVLAGIEAAGGHARLSEVGRPLVVCPADFPALRASTVDLLLRTLAAGASLAVPTHAGRRGHPLAIGPQLIGAVTELDLGIGLRQILERHTGSVVEVAVDDEGVVLNVNTVDDYERLLARSR